MEEKLLNLKETSAITNVPYRTLYAWVRDNKCPIKFVKFNHITRFYYSDVLQFKELYAEQQRKKNKISSKDIENNYYSIDETSEILGIKESTLLSRRYNTHFPLKMSTHNSKVYYSKTSVDEFKKFLDTLMTPEEVAFMLNIHMNTLQGWVNKKKLNLSTVKCMRRSYFIKEEVKEFIQKNTNN
jgi:predicted DNA-binding transcriptional regulator AlpA